MKVATSCSQCRAAKRKCTAGPVPHSACMPCLQRRQDCSLSARSDSTYPKSLAPAVSVPFNHRDISTTDDRADVEDDVRDQLVDLYLKLIHDKPHTLFHPSSLKTRIRNGSLPRSILFSILTLAARFVSHPDIRQRVQAFFEAAKNSVKKAIDEVSLDNIHATILIGNICGAEGDPNGESLFFGIAFRMAQILRLPEPAPEDDAISQEIKLRTWWSLYMIDQWSSAGLDIPRQIHDSGRYRLPMPEVEFWNLTGGQSIAIDRQNFQPGLWGYMVILAKVFGGIQQLHRQLTDGALTDVDAELKTRQLASELEAFTRSLPPDLTLTPENLHRHAMLGLGQSFVALHLGYHHYSTLLYFQYLDVHLARIPNQTLFAARCKHHAAALSDLLRTASECPGCDAVYFIVAHMTVISSSALLHTLLFGEPDELPDTKRRLFYNFQVLLKLKEYWSDVEMMVCMRSIDRVYTVDKWIVKFLLQHALPIEGDQRLPVTPGLAERDRYAEDALAILRSAGFD
ncbi:uncharacterized protein CDV56_103322 [Aspergillus thermomutatus]|uniref:Zn(2)-C6 fungal-type domain-containing protein n=1 Tax=Aspergillus thermomutatus TaxID=41047 RepID=A0A397HF69_ASPTH|nr:uncharacterized protein CDV56_103322 [Aspergillus thermomutatus]RHZ61791.1 hypothetical protein CDV56_103322 [Aspergillus thermomutatus]